MTCLHSHPLGNLLALEKKVAAMVFFFVICFVWKGKDIFVNCFLHYYSFLAAERAQVEQFFKDSALSDRPVVCP